MFTCALCGGSSSLPVSKTDAKSNSPLNVQFCQSCGLVQQHPIPSVDELRVYYSHHYREDYKNTYFPKLKYVYRAGLAAKDRLNFLTTSLKSDNVDPGGLRPLDIGAGGGEVVYAASKSGFIASGIEPNEGYSEYARENYGVQVDTMHLDEYVGEPCDVITMFHVLEHMPNPSAVIEKVWTLLKPNGYFLVEVPNIEQADASPANIYFKAHLYYLSASTLVSFASTSFDPFLIESDGNLKILFNRKHLQTGLRLPNQEAVSRTKARLSEKGWSEYVTKGGGWKKPFKKLLQRVRESRLKAVHPREILDLALR